jgi:hypothetical protein
MPFIVAGNVAGRAVVHTEPLLSAGSQIEYLAEMVVNALQVALLELRAKQPSPRNHKERYIIAILVVGAGSSGATDLTGQ